MIIHRGKQQEGRQKPRQWGPLSAVRDAVLYNCERLGLPVPVALWPMWEGAGEDVHDVAGRQINGSAVGTPEWASNALRLAGGAYIEFSPLAETNGSATLSVFTHAKVETDGVDHFLVGRGATVTTLANIILFADDVMTVGTDGFVFNVGSAGDGSNRVNSASGVRTLNTWHSVVGVMNAAERRIFVNGLLSGASSSATQTVVNNPLNNMLRIGQWEGNSGVMQGTVGISAIWIEALTADQIALLHAQPYAMLEPIPRLRVFAATGFVLVSPADTTSGLSLPVTLTWQDVGATQYQVQVAATADTDFASPVVDELVATNSYEITSLAAGWYRWRVRYRM